MTEKQLKWQKRSRILWRLNGMVGFPFEEGVLTSLEHERLNAAFGIIRGSSPRFSRIKYRIRL